MTIRCKTTLLALSLAITAVSPILSFGQAPAAGAASPSKVAFVSLQEAVGLCNEGKQESAALQQRFASKQSALKAQDDELKKLKDDFQAQGPKLNADEQAARARVIQDKQKVFDRAYQDYQSEAQEAQQEAINKIIKKMLPVLEKFLLDHGYTAVFDISNPQSPVLWVSKDSMITEQLVSAYNAQSTASAAPAPAAGGSAKPKK